MRASVIPLLIVLCLGGCKPQEPAPLPPQVGTRTTPVQTPAATPPAAVDAAVATTAPGAAPAASADGEAVYRKACVTCHATGLAGAPKLGDAADWGPRIAQGDALLFEHATKGFTGKKGVMPPKGGFVTLSDDEIRAAIAYMTTAPAP
jgi:cytochrome c5